MITTQKEAVLSNLQNRIDILSKDLIKECDNVQSGKTKFDYYWAINFVLQRERQFLYDMQSIIKLLYWYYVYKGGKIMDKKELIEKLESIINHAREEKEEDYSLDDLIFDLNELIKDLL